MRRFTIIIRDRKTGNELLNVNVIRIVATAVAVAAGEVMLGRHIIGDQHSDNMEDAA
jgi:hypothetical protein